MNRSGKLWAVPMTGAGISGRGAWVFLSPKGFLRVELRDIETFLVVAEELHFRRAAERLCISAGRVSQTVRALEQEVGAPLFGRTTRRVRLTALGEQLRDDTREAFEQLRRAVHVARASARPPPASPCRTPSG